MSKCFLDTNVFVYAIDRTDSAKHKIAHKLIADLSAKSGYVVSTQVMQEFFVTVTKKFGMDPIEAKRGLQTLEEHEVIQTDPTMIHHAIECSVMTKISFWDGLIIAAAESSKCSMIYSEDLQSGQTIRGVRIENPFA